MTPGVELAPRERLIFALDGMTLAEATLAVRELHGVVGTFKIGPGLVYEGGLPVARQLANAAGGSGSKDSRVGIFLDMKSWDIPETMLNTLKAVEDYGEGTVVLATVHAFGLNFPELAKTRASRRAKLLAITLLTSQDQSDLAAMGVSQGVGDFVLDMTRRARDSGADGVVCSGHEVRRVREALGADFLTVTPGIRLAETAAQADDQKRVVTPAQAIANGADYLVVGRPIRNAQNRLQAATRIHDEIAQALAQRDEASGA